MSDQGELFGSGEPPVPAHSWPWCQDCRTRHAPGEHVSEAPLRAPTAPLKPPSHTDDPATSKAAAELTAPKSATYRARVLAKYVDRHLMTGAVNGGVGPLVGMTAEEMVFSFGRDAPASYSTLRSRITELRDLGWLQDSGHRRKMRNGHQAVVWELTPAAAKIVAEGWRPS